MLVVNISACVQICALATFVSTTPPDVFEEALRHFLAVFVESQDICGHVCGDRNKVFADTNTMFASPEQTVFNPNPNHRILTRDKWRLNLTQRKTAT